MLLLRRRSLQDPDRDQDQDPDPDQDPDRDQDQDPDPDRDPDRDPDPDRDQDQDRGPFFQMVLLAIFENPERLNFVFLDIPFAWKFFF